MNVQIEELPGCRIKVSMQFAVEDVNAAFAGVFKDLNIRGQIHGFRPGKTPRTLLVRHYGEDVIRDSARIELIQEHVEKVLEGLDIIGQPEFPDLEEPEAAEEAPAAEAEATEAEAAEGEAAEAGVEEAKPAPPKFAEGEPYELTFTATVGPRVKLGDLTGLSLVRPAPEATEEDVAEVLTQLQESHAEETKPDRDVVNPGDAVDLGLVITLEGEDEPIEEVDQSIIVGQGAHFPPIDDKLPGRIVGQAVEMDVTYPEDYHDDSLAGKSAHINATIKDLREHKLPELDDALAQKVDEEKFKTIEDLRAEIKRQIDEERIAYSRQELENQVAKALLERCEVELPDVLVEDLARRETATLGDELKDMGLDLDGFRDMTGVSPDEFQAGQLRRAHRLLTIHSIMEELAKQQEAAPGEEEIEAEMALYAVEQKLELSFLKQAAAVQPDFEHRLVERIIRRRTYDAILDTADLQDMPVKEYREKRDDLLRLADEAPEAESPVAESDEPAPAAEPVEGPAAETAEPQAEE